MLCKRCGRKLRSEESIRRGYGKSCFAKVGADEKRNYSEDKDQKEERKAS